MDFEVVIKTSRVLSAQVRTSDPIIVNEVSSSGGHVNCGVSRSSPVQVSVDVGKIQEMLTTATETEQAEDIQKLRSDGLKMQEEIDRFKVFRYSFSEAIPIFFNRLKSALFFPRPIVIKFSPVIGVGSKFVKT